LLPTPVSWRRSGHSDRDLVRAGLPRRRDPDVLRAVLTDGSRVPFARSYDKKHPPAACK